MHFFLLNCRMTFKVSGFFICPASKVSICFDGEAFLPIFKILVKCDLQMLQQRLFSKIIYVVLAGL